jgi:NADH-ubiquinone oxidoreductase chain 4
MAAPPPINLLGEIRLLNRLISWSWFRMLILMLLSFFTVAYTLYLFSYSQHGLIYSGLYSCSLCYVREFLSVFLHSFPLNLFILRADIVTFWI